jgi:hypothetical protein
MRMMTMMGRRRMGLRRVVGLEVGQAAARVVGRAAVGLRESDGCCLRWRVR